ncbi:MAG: hemolysin family protein [Gemmatimonadaceae bacterium]
MAEAALVLVLIAVATLTAAATSLRSVGRMWLRRWIDARLAGAVGDEEALERQQRLLEAGTAATAWFVAMAGVALALASDARAGRLAIEALGFVLALLLLGQLLPRAIARRRASRLLPALVPGLRIVAAVLWPFVRAAHAIARPFARQAGGTIPDESREDEIEDLLREGELEGIGEHTETEIIAGVVRFGEKTVAEVMTPRTAIFAVDEATHPREMARLIAQAGYSRVPVYRGSIDEIVGMVHVFDVLKTRGEGTPELRPVVHAPSPKRCNEMLFEMLRERMHLGVVLDEYGGTAGLVTLEDLLEELVGDIRDEHDEPAPDKSSVPERAIITDGSTALNEVITRLGQAIPDGEALDRPIGGLLARVLGRVPTVGERFHLAGLEVTVVDAEPARVARVLVTPAGATAPVALELPR